MIICLYNGVKLSFHHFQQAAEFEAENVIVFVSQFVMLTHG